MAVHGTLKTSPKDFFLHLAATITLYVALGSLITLLFSIIEYAFPTQAAYSYMGGYTSSMRFAIASIIILIPLYFLFVWFIEREITRVPEKAHLPVRRWLAYLTIFGAIALVAGDLITLINYFLNGDLTTRFLLKVVALLVVAAVVFWGYLATVRHPADIASSQKQIKFASGVGALIVIATLITGFVVVGSPMTARKIQRDTTRINDLSNLQGQIQNYWSINRKLPASMSALKDGLYSNIPVDPNTGAAYEYIPEPTSSVAPNAFKLCATFETVSDAKALNTTYYYAGAYSPDDWKHGTGRVCFDRSINPELYPAVKVPAPIDR